MQNNYYQADYIKWFITRLIMQNNYIYVFPLNFVSQSFKILFGSRMSFRVTVQHNYMALVLFWFSTKNNQTCYSEFILLSIFKIFRGHIKQRPIGWVSDGFRAMHEWRHQVHATVSSSLQWQQQRCHHSRILHMWQQQKLCNRDASTSTVLTVASPPRIKTGWHTDDRIRKRWITKWAEFSIRFIG